MAKLPSETDIGRVLYRPSSGDIRIRTPDFSPIARGGEALAGGIRSFAAAQEDVDDYETRKALLDFKLQTEMELEETSREMAPGGSGFTRSWLDTYRKQARQFVGKDDTNIPASQRGKVGLLLKQHEVSLAERAQRYEMAERDREHVAGLDDQLGRLMDVVGASPTRRDEMAREGRRQIELSRIPAAEKHRLVKRYEKNLDKTQATARIMGIETPEDLDAFAKELRLDQEDIPVKARVGAVSAKYESSGRGVGLVSSGKNDPGGPSYGVHQLSSKDSMPAFLGSPEGSPYADRFGDAQPGTREFNRVYREIAREDPEGFAGAQYAFYHRTHYEPLLDHARARGVNVEDRGVQEALFSMAIQHGGARKIVDAIKAGGSTEDQIRALYEARAKYVAGLDLHPSTKASVLNRYAKEVRDAVRLAGTTAEDEAEPDSTRPYPNLSLMERRTIYGQAQTAFKERQKELGAIAAREQVAGWLAGDLPFNPMSKDGRKLLDDTLATSDIGTKIFDGDLTATSQGVALSQQLRYAPQPVAEGITGLIRSGDTGKMALGYSAVVNLIHRAPNALDQAPGHEQIVKDALKFQLYTNRYGGPAEALKRMAEDADPEKQRLRKITSEDANKFVKDEISEDTIRREMSRGTLGDWWNRPDVAQNFEQRALMLGEYKDMARREFELTGDKELAIKLATQQFQKRHGVSDLLSKRVMAYPPERFWPPVGGTYDYMEKDIKAVVGEFGPDADESSIGLKFAGFGVDGKPSYWITWRREDGRLEMSPRPWVPGFEEADRAADEEWLERRREQIGTSDSRQDDAVRLRQMREMRERQQEMLRSIPDSTPENDN